MEYKEVPRPGEGHKKRNIIIAVSSLIVVGIVILIICLATSTSKKVKTSVAKSQIVVKDTHK